jgi:hypothetical protein
MFIMIFYNQISLCFFAQAPEVEEPQEPEPVEKWEQASTTEQEGDEGCDVGGDDDGGEGGDGAPDGPVDFTIKAEQQSGQDSSPAEEANDMAAFLASAVRSASQFQVEKIILAVNIPHHPRSPMIWPHS